MLARARYNNVAETEDELTFRQGDVVNVIKKDFNQQRDWWLCELRGKVGMVPANYLEIFHEQATYDIPKPSKKASRSPHTTLNPQNTVQDEIDSPIYDLPPADVEIGDRDYDVPPPEAPQNDGQDYDRPPSSSRISPMGSIRSSMKSNQRNSMEAGSVTSSRNSSCIYDVPPEMMDTYDLPKPYKGATDPEEKELPMLAVDISTMYDDEAEELLISYRQLMQATYDVLFQTVYGPDAYWGTENKLKRVATLKNTLQAVKHFDRALVALLEFGKGVVNALGSTSDANFKKKYTSAFQGLLENRADILEKVEQFSSEINSITATVKSLLEVARAIPKAVTEFTVLVGANKALLFKIRNVSTTSLPVITKSDLKVRPLPERPPQVADVRKSGDYALPVESLSFGGRKTPEKTLSDSSIIDSNTARKRKPNDHLPPLPYAPNYGTMQKPARPPKRSVPEPTSQSSSPYGSEGNLKASSSPVLVRRSEDYDEINDKIRDRSIVLNKRPSLASLNSSSSRDASPTHIRSRRREQSLSSCSGSSEELTGIALRRVNSADILDGPYGRPNGRLIPHHVRQTSSPQPLRDEDRELIDRFSKQLDLIIPSLRETVDIFIDCLKDNEPPIDFVTKSKLTVVAAYKLVYIADALTQKILHTDTKAVILAASNELTDAIKNLVSSTKTAALQYPSVMAKDNMTGSLKLLLPAALDLINSVKTRASFV